MSSQQESILSVLRQQIIEGTLAPGSRVATRAELATRFALSINTVQRALDRLHREGFVVPIGSRGTFVAEHPPHTCRYGLVFENRAELLSGSRFWTALLSCALNFHDSGPRQLRIYRKVEPHVDNPDYQQLLADVRSRSLAGVIFAWRPEKLVHGLLFDMPDLARVALMVGLPIPNCLCVDLDLQATVAMAMDELVARGRRRVAVLTIAGTGADTVEMIRHAARQRGLHCPAHWVQSVDFIHPQWANPLVQLLLQAPAGERPDGLIISDDNLVEHATAGILASGVRVPEHLSVVAYRNTPAPAVSLVPATRIGLDVNQVLHQAIDLIDQQRAGAAVERMIRLRPAFAGDADLHSSKGAGAEVSTTDARGRTRRGVIA